jgi:hypothetical protein
MEECDISKAISIPKNEEIHIATYGFVKSLALSLRGAKRRGNLAHIRPVRRLLRFPRNDKPSVFGLFTKPSLLATQRTSPSD